MKNQYVLLGAALALLYAGITWLPSRTGPEDFAFARFGQLPVQVGGRTKPLDTVSRYTLMLFREKQHAILVDEASGRERRLPALQWMLEVSSRPDVADNLRVFRITHPELRGLLGLVGDEQKDFSFNELRPHLAEIERQFEQVNPEPQLRNTYQKAVFRLRENIARYHRLLHSFHPLGNPDGLMTEYAQFLTYIEPGLRALARQQAGLEYDENALRPFLVLADRYLDLSRQALLRVVPPHPESEDQINWENIGESLLRSMSTGEIDPYVLAYADITEAYWNQDPYRFNAAVNRLHDIYEERFPAEARRTDFEFIFNQAEPFYRATVLYVLAFLLFILSWVVATQPLNRLAYGVLVVTFLVHTLGLIARIYISGRPPVTNLYSSAVFVGWGACALGLIVERWQRNGVGGATAALVGLITLIIAHHLALTGDTLELMRAVLDSNFWLATHVIIITIGYSAVFLAGAIGLIFVVRAMFTHGIDRAAARNLYNIAYGITCFGLLFSLVGTLLGGIWADQSWGRFWGWDPKENGALMIVLWGAVMLHARWGGLVGVRGFMLMAIFGNIVTAWSWFGTNMLGVGLHSYGFMDAAFRWIVLFVLSQLAFIAIGLLPARYWRSPIGITKPTGQTSAGGE